MKKQRSELETERRVASRERHRNLTEMANVKSVKIKFMVSCKYKNTKVYPWSRFSRFSMEFTLRTVGREEEENIGWNGS